MSDFILSPNMSLPIPIVGQDPGPDYANNLNASLTLVDGHDHTAGSGVPITPNGMNISSDLAINSNNLTLVKTVNFSSQLATLPGTAPNLGCIYVAGNELVYNDEVGNVVPITNNGNVNSGAGSITGLPSGTASASYSTIGATFIWRSATSTPASMDFGSAILRNIVANSKGLTLNPPSGMGADIVETLPTPPGATSFMTMDNAGNMGVSIPVTAGITGSMMANQTITEDKLAPRPTGQTVGIGGFATSPSSGSFASTSTSPVDVTGLSVTITTTGRPVMIGLIADGGGTTTQLSTVNFGNLQPSGQFLILSGSTVIASYVMNTTTWGTTETLLVPASSVSYIDAPAAGTYTYKAQVVVVSASTSFDVINCKLYAYEI